MTILGIETATAVCAAALARDGGILAERAESAPHIHSERLLLLIDEVMRGAGVAMSDLDAIAVSIGPGSFTGLRIGLSVAKGLAFACALPVLPVSTLQALAVNARRRRQEAQAHEETTAEEYILPVLDARRNEAYYALFRAAASSLETVLPAGAASLEELVAQLPQKGRIIISGDGAEKVQSYALSAAPETARRMVLLPPGDRQCSAGAVALEGAASLAAGNSIEQPGADLASLEPVYIKEFHTTLPQQHLPVR